MNLADGLAFLAVGLAIFVPLLVDYLKRPRLRVEIKRWAASEPVDQTYVAVNVSNKPRRVISRLFSQENADGCRAFADFTFSDGTNRFRDFTLGWSDRPQPVTTTIVVDSDGRETLRTHYAIERVTERRWASVPSGHEQFEVAMAVLFSDGNAYMFGPESYRYGLRHPEWDLKHGSFDITVRIEGSGCSATETFRLEFESADFTRFVLEPVPDRARSRGR